MATFVNTSDLKNDTNKILNKVQKGPVIVTRHGHPYAMLIPIQEENFEKMLLSYSHAEAEAWYWSQEWQKKEAEADQDVQSGKIHQASSADDFIKKMKS